MLFGTEEGGRGVCDAPFDNLDLDVGSHICMGDMLARDDAVDGSSGLSKRLNGHLEGLEVPVRVDCDREIVLGRSADLLVHVRLIELDREANRDARVVSVTRQN